MTFGDSLQQGHSRFYSEILKIRDIVSLTNGSEPVLFLLDEILGGTNSHDRRIGAQAIVRSLVNAGAIGLVTTHDLALTELAADPGVHARNGISKITSKMAACVSITACVTVWSSEATRSN